MVDNQQVPIATTTVHRRQHRTNRDSLIPIQKLIRQLESQGVISKTRSPFNSPIWPVCKSNDECRLTVDYRGLNEVTPPLRAAVPDMLELQFELESKAAKCFPAKKYKDYEDNSPSYDGYYTEDDPVYGNLNQDILEECCYRQMKSQPQRPVNQLQVESAHQMCYASLDHSVKGKRRKPRRKKGPSLEEDEEERSSNPTMMASKVSIYLNSEQLAAENTTNVEAIHDDPMRLMGLIHTTKERTFEVAS
ncbi:T-cell receptor-associated transmembrane adapter 1-like [Columba livia]|uniref:T-cell receptor-associated transmembrane adapter 1-like n=1 Tax=Columba livia TaxID=8932 RepID=UPI0031BA6AD6